MDKYQAEVPDLVAVNINRMPHAHKAWAQFRREVFGYKFVPDTFTVPTEFPPQTDYGIQAYKDLLKQWHKEIEEERKRGKKWG